MTNAPSENSNSNSVDTLDLLAGLNDAERLSIIQASEGIVDQFRRGDITKTNAILGLFAAIPDSTNAGSHGNDAIVQFLAQIEDEFESTRRATKRAQPIITPGASGNSGPSRTSSSTLASEPVRGSNETIGLPEEANEAGETSQPTSLIRSRSPLDDSTDVKRVEFDKAELPWLVEDESCEPLSPLLEKTRKQLLEWAKDPRAVVTSIINSPRHVSFPESEWLAIVKGHAVNFDKIHTHRLSISGSVKDSRRVANGIDILVGDPEPTKYVKTAHDWVEVWYLFDEAMSLVSPHRKSELREYHTWISARFSAYHESAHQRVITLDRKVRMEVASRRDVALNDFRKFDHLEITCINDLGRAVVSSKTGSGPGWSGIGHSGSKPQKVQAPCNRFNQGRCTSSASRCKYLHVCSRCRQNGHAVEKCSHPSDKS